MKHTNNKPTPTTTQYIQQIPFIVRLIFLTLILSHALDWFSGGWVDNHLTLDSLRIFIDFQLWRILTFWVYEPSLLTLCIMLANTLDLLSKFQRKNSSAVLLNDFFVNLYFFGSTFLCLQLGLSFVTGQYPNYNFSIVYMWINMLYKYCYYNSDQLIYICCLNRPVKIIYYPFIMLAVVCAVNFDVRYDALMGVLFGVVQCRYFKGGMILFVKDSYIDKHKAMDYLGLTKLSCWQNLDPNQIELNQRWTASSSQFYINLANYQPETKINQEDTGESNSSQVFQGNGVVIGGDGFDGMG